jgi:hypothetical protein
MNEVTTTQTGIVSAETMHSVMGTGDLSKLTTAQRVEYYAKVCQTIGLNPLTRPFRFLQFQGQIQLYATKDCCDQLRNIRNINLTIAEKRMEGDLFIVTVQGETPSGRKDEDIGAVSLGRLQGEARANAIMKGITKAKRRCTLSICGLGFLDETEVDTLQGAKTFDAEDSLPRTVAPLVTSEPAEEEKSFVDQVSYALANEPNGTKWLKLLRVYVDRAETLDDIAAIRGMASVTAALKGAPTTIKQMIDAIFRDKIDALAKQVQGEEDEGLAAKEEGDFPGDWPADRTEGFASSE